MRQPRDGAGLALEAANRFGLIEPAGMQHLQGDPPFHVGIETEVDDAETALPQLALDAIGTDVFRPRRRESARRAVGEGGRFAEQLIERRQGAAELGMASEQRLHGPRAGRTGGRRARHPAPPPLPVPG